MNAAESAWLATYLEAVRRLAPLSAERRAAFDRERRLQWAFKARRYPKEPERKILAVARPARNSTVRVYTRSRRAALLLQLVAQLPRGRRYRRRRMMRELS
jgi:hypothetical protein